MILCPKCGRKNSPRAIKCLFCGNSLLPTPAPGYVRCTVCNTDNIDSEMYCVKCGSVIQKKAKKNTAVSVSTPVSRQPDVYQPLSDIPAFSPADVIPPATSIPIIDSYVVKDSATTSEQQSSYPDDISLDTLIFSPKEEEQSATDQLLDAFIMPQKTGTEKKNSASEQKKKTAKTEKVSVKRRLPLYKVIVIKIIHLLENSHSPTGTNEQKGNKKTAKKNRMKVTLPKNLNSKKAIFFIVVFLLLVLLLSLFANGRGETLIYDELDYSFRVNDGHAYLTANDSFIAEISGISDDTSIFYDLYGTCGVFSVSYIKDGQTVNSVYGFKNKEASQLLESMSSLVMLSAEGKALLYLDASSALRLYTIDTASDVLIAENGAYITGSIAISPDGEYVLYCYKNEAGTNSVCVWNDGKTKDVCSSGVPVAVSNGGKRIFYLTVLNNSFDFYCTSYRKTEKFTKLAADIYANDIFITYDLGQVLFTLLDGSTYCSIEGKEAVRISSSSIQPVLCDTVNRKKCSGVASFYGMDTFFNGFWVGERGIYSVPEDSDPILLAASPVDVAASDSGKEIVYTDTEGNLYCLTLQSIPEVITPIADRVSDIGITGDGKSVYYLSKDSSLYYMKNGGTAVSVASNVTALECSTKGVFFKTSDSADSFSLFYSENGGKIKTIAENVYEFFLGDGCAYYTTESGLHLFYSKNGTKNFSQVY